MSSAFVLRIPILSQLPDFGHPLPRWAWTAIGALSIPLWATWPTLAVTAAAMPPFQLLIIAFAIAWLVLTLADRPTQSQKSVSWGRLVATLICSVGLLGTNALLLG